MKIIQSFWSANNHDIFDSKGWFSAKYHWLSWVLSVNQLRKYHEDVELYTDKFGYKILIETLQLPYTKVHVVLDELNHYPQGLWAISKIKTYSLQNEPFIHVDGDVFVWESLTDKFKTSNLITQNLEHTTEYYRKGWEDSLPSLHYIPDSMQNYHHGINKLACNMGIVGGTDLEFFQEYSSKSFDFVDKNKSGWESLTKNNFNVFFEQVLFYELATIQNKKIDFLFEEIPDDNNYVGFGEFESIPYKKTYLHLLGDYKRLLSVCLKMDKYVLKNYPTYYNKVIKLIDNEFFVINSSIFEEKNIEKLQPNFIKNIKEKKQSFSELEYLVARDLYSVNSVENYLNLLQENKDFKIFLNSGWKKNKVHPFEVPQYKKEFDQLLKSNPEFLNEKSIDEYLSSLEPIDAILISEVNEISNIYDTDEIDDIIFHELKNAIQYSELLNNLSAYYEGEQIDDEFITLIKNRLKNYLVLKIITIC